MTDTSIFLNYASIKLAIVPYSRKGCSHGLVRLDWRNRRFVFEIQIFIEGWCENNAPPFHSWKRRVETEPLSYDSERKWWPKDSARRPSQRQQKKMTTHPGILTRVILYGLSKTKISLKYVASCMG